MEQNLSKNPELHQSYCEFMDEYVSLGHMKLASNYQQQSSLGYFMPHHSVVRENSTTTKVRVVFNASHKSNTGCSLNDFLMIGPTIQDDIFTHLVRFRSYRFALVADISKMYRQINVRASDQNLQKIYWRRSDQDPIQIYMLNTVTYGTASAPFAAIRTLKQLAHDECVSHPIAAPILLKNFYVDDLVSGAESVESAINLKRELTSLLSKGGFELRKWCSNHAEITPSINHACNDTITVLGLSWNHRNDTIQIIGTTMRPRSKPIQYTKRSILSSIAQAYDPIGLVAPVIYMAKLFMQKLWCYPSLNWDDNVPSDLISEWIEISQELNDLSTVSIPRSVLTLCSIKEIELHGFGDASKLGYGCVLYVRVIYENGTVTSNVLCAKSRVAPIKEQTIPRLELCASLLLAETYSKLSHSVSLKFNRIVLWTDSEITLHRIRSSPSKYCTFVANRLSKIQDLTQIDSWRYVSSKMNPADIVSRGSKVNELKTSEMWWHGPPFFVDSSVAWPEKKIANEGVEMERDETEMKQAALTTIVHIKNYFVSKYSELKKLVRISALCSRYVSKIRYRIAMRRDPNQLVLKPVHNGPLQACELELAMSCLCKFYQNQHFKKDIDHMNKNKCFPKQSPLKNLNPFFDSTMLLRVGGRLSNSNLGYDQKHPIIVPKCKLAELIVQNEHRRNLHAGPQALLSFVRQKYWVIDGRNMCRKIFHKCLRCFRMKPTSVEQLMGQLPANRVQIGRAFENVGVDYCGPFAIKSIIRSKVTLKAYVAIFICFSTKAVHIEVVHDLSTPSFISAFRRFVARRGRCINMYSDNATNFIGARAELRELQRLFDSDIHRYKLANYFAEENINWMTIPPRSPHFGGLWEAAVKSMKHHLKASLGTYSCTIEELMTITAQIEAILNSRPITPMSNNVDDLAPLTPGHFLVGRPLNSLPDPTLMHLKFNRLSRYQRLQYCTQIFWKRWSSEYLSELQRLTKWQTKNPNIKEGAFVLLKDDNAPPLKWLLGRIIKLYPGKDELVRVVSVRTASGVFDRGIDRVCVLPIENEPNEGIRDV